MRIKAQSYGRGSKYDVRNHTGKLELIATSEREAKVLSQFYADHLHLEFWSILIYAAGKNKKVNAQLEKIAQQFSSEYSAILGIEKGGA